VVTDGDMGIREVVVPPLHSLQCFLVFGGGRVGLVMRIPSTPSVCIHDVANEDCLRSLVLITDTLTVLPVPCEVGRAVQVSDNKYFTHGNVEEKAEYVTLP